MTPSAFTLPVVLALSTLSTLHAAEPLSWPPTIAPNVGADLPKGKRTLEVYEHGSRPEWRYAAHQGDSLVVIHPIQPRKQAPLYVVLHSAGHDVFSCVKCTPHAGNHDIYRSPEDFYALYLDCRANKDSDWWWGGMHSRDKKLSEKNAGSDLQPVERRVIDCVKWAITKYDIDPNRVYLCGNSMGGSGTLGIGLRHGDLFAAIKANVPAGIEHASHRMGFPPYYLPTDLQLPEPPILVDYSGTNDRWSEGHDRLASAMNDRKYPLYLYWGPFGHANNDSVILKSNDLIHSFDWLAVRKNAAYPVFTNGSCNDLLPWPDELTSKKPGQINAFFRGTIQEDSNSTLKASLFLSSPQNLKTAFAIPETATADVSFRRLQYFNVSPGDKVRWIYGDATGHATVGSDGVLTIPRLLLKQQATTLTIR